MSFSKLPAGELPIQPIGLAMAADSPHVPYINLIHLQPDGTVALYKRTPDEGLHIPDGSVHRPNPHYAETVEDKVAKTIGNRTNAFLGRKAVIESGFTKLVPASGTFTWPNICKEERKRWPNARLRLHIPAVVPVIINGPDPFERYITSWYAPQEAIEVLQDEYYSYRDQNTLIAHDALQVSLPFIQVLTRS